MNGGPKAASVAAPFQQLRGFSGIAIPWTRLRAAQLRADVRCLSTSRKYSPQSNPSAHAFRIDSSCCGLADSGASHEVAIISRNAGLHLLSQVPFVAAVVRIIRLCVRSINGTGGNYAGAPAFAPHLVVETP
jgi:hypothetical protein